MKMSTSNIMWQKIVPVELCKCAEGSPSMLKRSIFINSHPDTTKKHTLFSLQHDNELQQHTPL